MQNKMAVKAKFVFKACLSYGAIQEIHIDTTEPCANLGGMAFFQALLYHYGTYSQSTITIMYSPLQYYLTNWQLQLYLQL